LVGGHAYVVTGYNASTDRFTLFNPWGSTHPAPLTWQQLQSNCSMFVVANPNGSVSGGAGIARSAVNADVLAGVGVVDVLADASDPLNPSDDDATLALLVPMTDYVSCGYDESAAFTAPSHNPSDLLTLASTSESHGGMVVDSTIASELLLLES
jgi:hypothetical protein